MSKMHKYTNFHRETWIPIVDLTMNLFASLINGNRKRSSTLSILIFVPG